MSKISTISLAIISLIMGIGLGYVLSPYYSMNKYNSNSMKDLGMADRYLDLRYIDLMIAHHESAMVLAKQATNNSQRDEIINLSKEILENEPKAINELYTWKKDWYKNEKNIPASDVQELGDYTENFDLRFLNALISHHQEGILMAKEVQLKSSRTEILDNADSVIAFLEESIKTLKLWRSNWYGI